MCGLQACGFYPVPVGPRSSLPVRYVAPPTVARQVSVPGGQQYQHHHLYGVVVPMTKFRRAVAGDGATPVAHSTQYPRSRSPTTATSVVSR